MSIQYISREWRTGLVEAASIGYDHDAPNSAARWIVTETRTESGKQMQRTDEPMIELSSRHFANDRDASAWMHENGYR